MVEKYVALIDYQIEKLNDEAFDFEAWKSGAMVILGRVFGPNDLKVQQLDSIRVEYGSSWSMRAVSGSFNPIASAIKQGREILTVAKKELELFGDEFVGIRGKYWEDILSAALKLNEYKKLQTLLNHNDLDGLEKFVNGLESKTVKNILLEALKKL
ncbi:MAG: hypothetical protein OEY34_06060 [Cyclobacteriaceae bacterium]|nr:hypothetical protein [Cyclobacteriaceae bacterium]